MLLGANELWLNSTWEQFSNLDRVTLMSNDIAIAVFQRGFMFKKKPFSLIIKISTASDNVAHAKPTNNTIESN